jgi:hypothetical protein
MGDPFAVKDCALIAVATGEYVQTLRELKEKLAAIPTSCIYYHFWGGLLRPRFDDPEYQNDFAIWSWRSLHDKTLAERLAVIDPTDFGDLNELRRELIEVIEERLDENELLAWVIPSHGFHFVRSQIVVFDTGRRFSTIDELSAHIVHMSPGTIFYHMNDARGEHRISRMISANGSWGLRRSIRNSLRALQALTRISRHSVNFGMSWNVSSPHT